jgi:hypothetical protein
MRSVILWLMTVGLAVAVAQGEDAAKDDDAPAVTESQAIAIGKMIETLNGETKIDVIETPLGDICRDIGKAHEIKVVIDEAALKKAEISLGTLVTLNVKEISLRDGMFKLLDPHGLTYKIRPDGLLITTLPKKAK